MLKLVIPVVIILLLTSFLWKVISDKTILMVEFEIVILGKKNTIPSFCT